ISFCGGLEVGEHREWVHKWLHNYLSELSGAERIEPLAEELRDALNDMAQLSGTQEFLLSGWIPNPEAGGPPLPVTFAVHNRQGDGFVANRLTSDRFLENAARWHRERQDYPLDIQTAG